MRIIARKSQYIHINVTAIIAVSAKNTWKYVFFPQQEYALSARKRTKLQCQYKKIYEELYAIMIDPPSENIHLIKCIRSLHQNEFPDESGVSHKILHRYNILPDRSARLIPSFLEVVRRKLKNFVDLLTIMLYLWAIYCVKELHFVKCLHVHAGCGASIATEQCKCKTFTSQKLFIR